MATLWAHVNEPPPALAATHPELGNEIDRVLTRALAKAPRTATRAAASSSPRPAPRSGFAELGASASQARAPPRCPAEGAARSSAPAAAVSSSPCSPARCSCAARTGLADRADVGRRHRPASGKLVADIPLGFESSLIAAGEGFVWVLDPKASTLTRIDPETMEVVATAGIPADGSPTGSPSARGRSGSPSTRDDSLAVLQIGPELGELPAAS